MSVKTDIADPFTTAGIRARGQHLSPEERDTRACATIDRHALNPEDRAELLAMLGLTPPPAPTPKPPKPPRKPPVVSTRTAPPDRPQDWPCTRCGRNMWHRSWPDAERAGRIMWGARTVCTTCYQHVRRKELAEKNA